MAQHQSDKGKKKNWAIILATTKTATTRTMENRKLPVGKPLTPSWVGRVPYVRPGAYADGMPVHQVQYLCCKLILRPNRFVSRESFFEFGKALREPAKDHGVKFRKDGFDSQPVKLREVLFIDTEDFRLYNNAFILRRRIATKTASRLANRR